MRSGWTKLQQMYENIHANLGLVLLFKRTEVEYGKGPSCEGEVFNTRQCTC